MGRLGPQVPGRHWGLLVAVQQIQETLKAGGDDEAAKAAAEENGEEWGTEEVRNERNKKKTRKRIMMRRKEGEPGRRVLARKTGPRAIGSPGLSLVQFQNLPV